MYTSAKSILLGSTLLLAGLPLVAAETGNAGVASAPRAFVSCPGISSVPMTSDAEQVLPLSQVASLACGDAVSVVTDSEGYTALVRTADGKQGYVARMYLTSATPAWHPQPHADAGVQPTSATPRNGVVRWMSGAAGCETFQSHGRMVESVTANGITVQVSLQDTGWKLLATVAVSNQSGQSVYVFPNLVTLDELQPNLRNLPEQNPAKLAHSELNHQLFRDEANAHPPRSAVATLSETSGVSNVSYRTTQDFTVADLDNASAHSLALKTVNLVSGQNTAGVLWYARDLNAHQLSMRLSIGDMIFDFPFAFEQKK
jgi:hypothetical protein